MKKLLLLLFLLPCIVRAQMIPIDSVTFRFSPTDSLSDTVLAFGGFGLATARIDTAGDSLWQIGNTLKPTFTDGVTALQGIMTDTLHPYPTNANASFTLKVHSFLNYKIKLWHKYQTDSLHAGCIIEFSSDSGATWINAAQCPGMILSNIYAATDTLLSGQPAFMGNSNGQQYSSLLFLNCSFIRTTSTVCFPNYDDFGMPETYIRFRFVSDSTPDSLSGWMIDSIRVVNYDCEGEVAKLNAATQLEIFPNPTDDVLSIRSGSDPMKQVTITNIFGKAFYQQHPADNRHETTVDVTDLPPGIYFVKVNNDVRKFVKE